MAQRTDSVGRALKWLAAILCTALLVIPLLASIAFVHDFSTTFPLTDEWFFVHKIISLQGADFLSFSGIADALSIFPTKFAEHCVTFPFLFYWPIAEWSQFESRWVIYLTVAAFCVQALLFRLFLVRSSLWVLPIVLLLFCPSHYMEFLWAWQFTLAFSIVFPLIGLVIIDRMPVAEELRSQGKYIAAGVAFILLGTASSAGGFFGFPCAMLILALKPLPRVAQAAWIGVLALIGVALYAAFMHDPGRVASMGFRQVMYVFTALGATIWGSPVGLFEFEPDIRSTTGFVIFACTVAVVVRAMVIRALPQLALALSVTLFGYLCVVPIAMTREYLGNWHLQYALPAVCGAYAAGYTLWKADRSVPSALPFFGLVVLLTSCLFGWHRGFTEYGPAYHAYIRSIESYVKHNLVEPGLPRSFPHLGEWDMDARTLLFLSAHEHPLFANARPPARVRPVPWTSRVFVDQAEVLLPLKVFGGQGRVAVLTIAVPGEPRARGVLAQIGSATLVLRRVHASHTGSACCSEPNTVCFMGMIVPRLLADGAQPVQFSVFE